MKNKTVITGMGMWSCIGSSVAHATLALKEGRCGIAHCPELLSYGYRSDLMGVVDSPSVSDMDFLKLSLRKCLTPLSARALAATREAIGMCGIKDFSRTALIVSNDSSADALHEVDAIMNEKHDTRFLRSFRVFRSLNSTVSMVLSQAFGIGGLSLTVSAACAGGGHAVGIAHSLIQAGVIDAAVVVGAQEVNRYAFSAFDALGVFAQNTDAHRASRPFDATRNGLVPSGGAACVVVESALHAVNRQAPVILGSVDGYGFSTNNSLVSPSAEGERDAMCMALRMADCKSDDIDLVAAHATGTVDGDRAEAEAIASLFCGDYHVSAVKALVGHECWMAGVSQVVYSLIQMQGGFVAPNVNFDCADPASPGLPVSKRLLSGLSLQRALCNAFGFGGTNSCLVLSCFN